MCESMCERRGGGNAALWVAGSGGHGTQPGPLTARDGAKMLAHGALVQLPPFQSRIEVCLPGWDGNSVRAVCQVALSFLLSGVWCPV